MVSRRTYLTYPRSVLLFSALLVLTSSSAQAAIAMVQSNGNYTSSASSFSLAFTSNTTRGNLIVVCLDFSYGSNFSAVSDTQANTFTQAGVEVAASNVVRSRCYYAPKIAGGADTVTFTITSGPAFMELYIDEVSGAAYSSPLDQFCNVNTTQATVSCGVTAALSNEILIGHSYSQGSATAGTGFTTDSAANGNLTEHKIVSTAGTYTISAGSTGTYCNLIGIAFKSQLLFFIKRRDDP